MTHHAHRALLLTISGRAKRGNWRGRVAGVVPDIDAWQPWHPAVLAERLADLSVPWCVAAGWALDLFRGRQTRDHHDVEIAVPRARFAEVARRFPDIDFYVPVDGTLVAATPDTLALAARHQTWALDRVAGSWRFDVFREPHDGDVWICRRDARIRRSYADVIRHDASGLPYLAPEVVLLFKAKDSRDKDVADFAGVLPLLDADQRHWLADAIALVHPDHPWQAALTRAG
jgi:Aminoglycoside-2''-adenylyltransferase